MKKSVASCIVIGVAVTLVVTILATIFMHPLLRLLKTPAEILEESYSYISILSIFLFVMFAYNLCSGLLRAIGNSFMPLVFLIFSSLVNIVLDLLFIRTFGMGVRGAAIATVIAQGHFRCALPDLYCYESENLLPEKRHFALDRGLYADLLAQGFSMGFMSSIIYVGSIVLQPGINSLGYETIAGHTAARKLFFVLHDAAFLHGAGRQHLRCTEPRRRQLGARAERHPLRLHFLLQRNRVPDCNRHPACTNHGTPDLWFIRPDRPRKRSPLPPRSHPVFLRPWSCQLQPSGTAGTRRENSAVAVELY